MPYTDPHEATLFQRIVGRIVVRLRGLFNRR